MIDFLERTKSREATQNPPFEGGEGDVAKHTTSSNCGDISNIPPRLSSKWRTFRTVKAILFAGFFLMALPQTPAKAQLIDPQSSLILSVLRDISFKHQLGLQQERAQTAKMIQQVKQFYDSYTLLRQDFQFTQSLYRDMKAVENLRLNNSFALSNFIINADRVGYWFPGTSQDLNRTAMDTESLLQNARALQETYDSFSLSTQDDAVPEDASKRLHNAYAGQEAFSKALFEQALRSQRLAVTYDSMAVALYREIMNKNNNFTEAERTQLLLETVNLRELSNSHHEKYLQLSQQVHESELNLYDEKVGYLRSKVDWQNLRNEANKISKVRYGFFDITPVSFR